MRELAARNGDPQILGLGQVIKEITVGKHIYDFDFCSKESYLCEETGQHYIVSDMSKRLLTG